MNTLKIYTDGGSRGNPGQGAAAFVVAGNSKVIHEESKRLGISTNNEAEYLALLMGISWLSENKKEIPADEIFFFLDSELVVNQINGIYKVKSKTLKKLFNEVNAVREKIGLKIFFKHIPRNKNKIADSLVNKSLDEKI